MRTQYEGTDAGYLDEIVRLSEQNSKCYGSLIFTYSYLLCISNTLRCQWRIYIEAKEAVLGGPRTPRAPQIYNKKKMAAE